MSMTPRERIMAVLNGEEPDKIPVVAYYTGDMTGWGGAGGWYRRLAKRGLGALGFAWFYIPNLMIDINPYVPDVKYTQIHYIEKGVKKFRHTFETPVGSITGVRAYNPLPFLVDPLAEEFFVKQPSDWRVVNYIQNGVIDKLAPTYEVVESKQDELGDSGIPMSFVERTPWQKAWIRWASLERAVVDFHEQLEEVQEFIEIQKRLHTRIAELAAESPARLISFGENLTSFISPEYYREYCMPIYEIYSKQLEGTGKVLGAHMDGSFGHLKKEIAEARFKIFDSYTVPPAGDVSLAEAKKIWPDKVVFMNFAPHLHWAEPKEVREGYEALADEWGSKKGLVLELSENLPPETLEAHISAAMDAFGY